MPAINAVKFWLRKHGATASEVPVYVSDIRDLFHQENNYMYVWGTQAEILICTFCLVFRPVFVATIKRVLIYYWENHMCSH